MYIMLPTLLHIISPPALYIMSQTVVYNTTHLGEGVDVGAAV